ncbi:Ribonuclease E [hydrothermal vent metagenome]|uniref:Ribonuclease E n=1 Tax=hydrothermal vent metagenome TaxID=652676 RepID=A0A3B0S9A6_9ZZZZ
MTIKMLIDATHEEETRVAIVHGNRVEEFDYESSVKKQIKGNIYLAKITRVEPSLQAAFVDYGGNRHGFLAFSEIHPDYYQIPVSDREELIAEEAAAYARLLEEEEEIVEKKPKRKPRRKPRRKTDKSEKTSEEVSDEADVKAEDNPADDASDHEKSEPEVKSPEAESPETKETAPEAAESPETPETVTDASDSDDDKPSVTKAESVSEADTITEEVSPDDDGDDDDDALDDETETTGSHLIDDEEAEEKLRIKIAKGLRRKYKIQEVIKKNQILLIQVVKEERGNKGAALTTYLSLPGRYCVLMPNTLHSGGVSRKIANMGERKSLKKILADLKIPSGIACIIRTAGQSRTKTEIKRDFDYLIRTWEGIRERTLSSVAPVMINEEGDLIKRSIRDLYTREIDEILVEGEKGYKTARSFMRLLMPSHARKIKHYSEQPPLFHKYQVENQLDSMYSPTVQLKSGGYIVINPTEALVSIDVNSGKATKEHNIEETARKTNLEAAEEVARQLRLRDMAGLIVIDFIDMEVRANNRAVEQKMKECLKSDRARIQVGRISSFGLMEMSRQRLRAGVLESSTRTCPHCEGSGVIRSVESHVLHILRALEEEGIKGRDNLVTLHLPQNAAVYLLNNKKAKLVSLEEQYNFTIEVIIDTSLTETSYKLELPGGDQKKSEKPDSPKHGKSRDNSQRDDKANSRRNRQRNQSRKNRGKDQDSPAKTENTQEKAEAPQEKSGEAAKDSPVISDHQEGKTRRRRRRPRRGNKNQTDTATDNANTGENTPARDGDDKAGPEKKTRRAYPPQARSRRKPADDKKTSTAKADSAGTNETSPPPAAEKTKAPESKPSESKSSGPKKSGWWQRTFG